MLRIQSTPLAVGLGLGAALFAALVVLAARRGWPLTRFVVRDESMSPALLPGDRLLVASRPAPWRPLRRDDVVVLRDPDEGQRFLVKRLAALPGDPLPPSLVVDGPVTVGRVVVLGDNRAYSRDSRSFGTVPIRSLVGVAVWRYLPAERRARL